jgi:pimeloyl-ACP methyl ester carboxylesterase
MRIEIEPGVRLFIDVDGASLVPDGPTMREKPTLLLLHGGPGWDHSGYKPRFSQLADIAQIVYVDHRGQGRSDNRPREEWTLDHWADDVVRLCDALGITKPVVFGQSFGGTVAQRYLARHPEHPARVILSSTSPHLRVDRRLAVFERLGGEVARCAAATYWSNPTPEAAEAYVRVCLPLYGRTPRSPDVQRRARIDLEIANHWFAGEARTLNLLPGLACAQCPVLVIGGEEDPVTPIEDQRDIAGALPAQWVEFHAFPGAGHGVDNDHEADFMALIRRFVQGSQDGTCGHTRPDGPVASSGQST